MTVAAMRTIHSVFIERLLSRKQRAGGRRVGRTVLPCCRLGGKEAFPLPLQDSSQYPAMRLRQPSFEEIQFHHSTATAAFACRGCPEKCSVGARGKPRPAP